MVEPCHPRHHRICGAFRVTSYLFFHSQNRGVRNLGREGKVTTLAREMGLRNFTIIGRKIIGLDAKFVKSLEERAEIFCNAEKFMFLKPTSSYVVEPKGIRLPPNVDAKCAGIFVRIMNMIVTL